jgi:glycosyltransferase involved in cell wall biosynthesis
MKFSLVLATAGRTTELERFLASLDAQTYRDFELIVVDQNPDERLAPLLEPYAGLFPMLRPKSALGLSRARNVGLQHVTGQIVGFPDDDCWYSPDLLERIDGVLREHREWDGVTGRAVDEQGFTLGRVREDSSLLNKFNVWSRAISIGLFLRRAVVMQVGFFDEKLGAGSGTAYGSGEETDYLIRSLRAGFRIYNFSDLTVNHPNPVLRYDNRVRSRAFAYGCGTGAVLKQHRYPLWFVGYMLLRPFGGTILSALIGRFAKSRYHWAIFKGRVSGWAD